MLLLLLGEGGCSTAGRPRRHAPGIAGLRAWPRVPGPRAPLTKKKVASFVVPLHLTVGFVLNFARPTSTTVRYPSEHFSCANDHKEPSGLRAAAMLAALTAVARRLVARRAPEPTPLSRTEWTRPRIAHEPAAQQQTNWRAARFQLAVRASLSARFLPWCGRHRITFIRIRAHWNGAEGPYDNVPFRTTQKQERKRGRLAPQPPLPFAMF